MSLRVSEVCELFGVGRQTAKKLLEIEKQFVKEQKKKEYLFFKREERKAKEQLNNSSTQ